jgi:Leucine-rich repeat (LRR) protein
LFYIYDVKFLNLGGILIVCMLTLSSCIGEVFTARTNLTSNYSHQLLTIVPEEVLSDTNSTALLLSFNKLSEVDDRLSNLNQLEKLSLQNNVLTSFPMQICTLKKLKFLSLSYNQIDSIPDCIGRLKELIEIRCTNCQLTFISDSIGFLPKLKFLELNFNQLDTLPELLFHDTSLVILNIGNNQLTTISDSISKLQKLKQLILKGNPYLFELPSAMCDLAKLDYLNIDPTLRFQPCAIKRRNQRLQIEY